MKQVTNKISLSKISAFLLLLMLNFIVPQTFAQESPKFTVKLKLNVHDGDFKNALITITKNGMPFKVIDPDGSTKNVDLDLNSNYLFTFTKMGYITKEVSFNTKVPDGRASEEFAKFKCTVDIWPQPEDAVVKFSQPVGKIQYSVENGDFDYDKNYMSTALEMQKQATEHPTPAPKPPTPTPRPEPPPPPPPKPVEVSKPIPVEVKQPEVVHEPPPPPKKKEIPPPAPVKKVEKNSVEKVYEDSHKKTTIVIVTLDGVDYVYKKEEYNWGATYFYKNNVYITEGTYRSETE